MGARVVGISHTVGAGGDQVGRLVAERLGFQFVDDEVVASAAEKSGLDPEALSDAEKRRRFLDRFVETLGVAGGGTAIGYAVPDVGSFGRTADFRALIRDAIAEMAERGEVVIASHAASIALAGRDDLLRVFVTASPATRAQRVAEAAGVDRGRAERMVKDEDMAREHYLKRFYRVVRELPTHYDVVVNTDVLTPEQAADVVAHAARG
jgi:cytidylate kinase